MPISVLLTCLPSKNISLYQIRRNRERPQIYADVVGAGASSALPLQRIHRQLQEIVPTAHLSSLKPCYCSHLHDILRTNVFLCLIGSTMHLHSRTDADQNLPLVDDEYLFGWDPLPGIVSVWANREGKAIIWRRESKQISRIIERFHPWILAS